MSVCFAFELFVVNFFSDEDSNYCLIGGCRIKEMYNHVNERSGQKAPLVADDVYEIIMKVSCLYLVKRCLNFGSYFPFGS